MAPVEGPRSGDSDKSGPIHSTEASKVELWSEKDRQQQLLHFKPQFTIPYPVGINTYAAKASKDTHDWLLEHGIREVLSPEIFAKFLEWNFPELPSRIYVDHGPNLLDWACKFFTWLFVLDYQMDETALGMKRGSSVPVFLELHLVLLWNFPDEPVLHENLMRFLDEFPNSELREKNRDFINNTLKKAKTFPVNTVYDGQLEPIASALRDLWTSSVRTMPQEFNLRLAQTIQGYFLGNLDEARNREDGTIPSLDDYTDIRRKTGAVEPTIVIIDLFEDQYMPSYLFKSPSMQQLMDATNDVVCWHNDIWSFKQELPRGDIHNLVILISLERKYSTYQECAIVAEKMLYDRITDIEKAAADLLAIAPPAYENVVRRYIKTCRYWVSGTEAFHKTCARYQ